MAKTDRANVDVRLLLVRVVLAGAEHLGAGLELGVDLEADSREVFGGGFHNDYKEKCSIKWRLI